MTNGRSPGLAFNSAVAYHCAMTMAKRDVRWGILSTAEIGRKNWKAIRHSGNGTVVAVASRDLERARQFIGLCQMESPFAVAPRALGSYEELLAAPDVDAVYIPLPTGIRREWVVRAAEAGKHVVCEKPCANTVEELRDMIAACRQRGVQFIDGVMFMHSERLRRMREVLDDESSIGDVRRIASAFSFCAPDEFFGTNIRANSALEPYGCLGDLGWYCIRFALWAAKWRLPRSVTGRVLSEHRSHKLAAPVVTEFSGELLFEGGVSSGFYCSFITANEQWAFVSGTKGYLRVSDFVAPFFGSETRFEVNNTTHHVRGCDFNMEAHWRHVAVPEYSNSDPTAHETQLFRNVAARIQCGTVNDFWPEIALKTQQVMSACLASARDGGRDVELA